MEYLVHFWIDPINKYSKRNWKEENLMPNLQSSRIERLIATQKMLEILKDYSKV